MGEYILSQADYLLRILVAAMCGLVIGYEREARMKMAGIRTHTIIAMAAALMVVVSKYGFFDVITVDGISVDASRVAASVVTGIGFLGAGIILNHKNSISGVTTSAGTWATLGIGMSIGAGMWVLGIGSTAMLLVIQFLFHRNWRIFNGNAGKILLHMRKGDDTRDRIISTLTKMNIQVVSTHMNIYDNACVEVSLSVLFPKDFSAENTMTLMANYPEIASIDL